MTIKDFKQGMKCTILAVKKGKQYQGEVTVRKVKKNYILVDVIRVKKRVVSLAGVSNFLLIEDKSGAPNCFQYIIPIIVYDRKDKQAYYQIKLKDISSVKFNRRKHFRCPIGAEINVRTDNSQKTYPCLLKDISASGFALIFTGKHIPSEYETIRTFHFIYNDFDLKNCFSATLNLTGVVKRCVHLNENQILFGCQFRESPLVEKYVADKMRIKQKKKLKQVSA